SPLTGLGLANDPFACPCGRPQAAPLIAAECDLKVPPDQAFLPPCGVVVVASRWARRALIQASTSPKSQATEFRPSRMRRGKSPPRSRLQIETRESDVRRQTSLALMSCTTVAFLPDIELERPVIWW